MLVLFDIDATILKTQRSGLYAMEDAFRALFARPCNLRGVSYAGRLDPLIFREVLEMNGVEATPENMLAFRNGYRDGMSERLARPGIATLLPGVRELVDRLQLREEITLGLCTGNFEDTGRMKLKAAGLDDRPFIANAFGDESTISPPHRRHLPPIALERANRLRPTPLLPTDVVVIGDTPADVDCALALGCRALGVATGLHDRETLEEAGAHLAVADLAAVDHIEDWIVRRSCTS